jgi:hypothetical protein
MHVRGLLDVVVVGVARALPAVPELQQELPADVNFSSMSSELPGGGGVPKPLLPLIQTDRSGAT